ncbi:MAG: peptide ABC transporter permease [Ardenticatenia bacterium]|jgi:ABC-type dipeptide/oligopeptide/nickel transport system permease component|nr:MAG: peptide ABC transporter permease [Ardenticatenia bacterium]
MGRYIARRLLWLLVVIFSVSVITFVIAHAVPGGPFSREKKLPPAVLKQLNEKYRLDDPLWKQYVEYMGGIFIPRLTSGEPSTSYLEDYLINIPLGEYTLRWMNFGPSYKSQSRTVNDVFRENLPVSAELGFYAFLVASVIGIPLGIVAALKQNTWVDYIAMGIAIFGVSVPVIVLGPVLIWLFAIRLPIFLPSGWGSWRAEVLPSIALGLGSSAIIARLTRASLLQVIREDYIRTARAKGLMERVVIIRHALRNSLIPVVTVMGPIFAFLVTGTFVTETIFGVPGMGRYFVTSITNRDYPVIMGTILLFAVVIVIANLIVDLLYAWLDPRIRYD